MHESAAGTQLWEAEPEVPQSKGVSPEVEVKPPVSMPGHMRFGQGHGKVQGRENFFVGRCLLSSEDVPVPFELLHLF